MVGPLGDADSVTGSAVERLCPCPLLRQSCVLPGGQRRGSVWLGKEVALPGSVSESPGRILLR